MRGLEPASGGHFSVNVNDGERLASILLGGFLIGFGLSRKSAPGALMTALGAGAVFRGASGHCPLYHSMAVSSDGKTAASPARNFFQNGVHVDVSQTIEKPVHELYSFWRDFSNLPKFMRHLKSVESQPGNRTQWTVDAPGGFTVSWTAEIINDEPNKRIAWRSLTGSDVDTAGSVIFTEAAGNTNVRIVLGYVPPAGKVGAAVARFFGHSGETDVREDLARFKQIMESGEQPTIDEPPRTAVLNHQFFQRRAEALVNEPAAWAVDKDRSKLS